MSAERTEDIIHRTYVLHGKRAIDSSSSVARNAHTHMADALQRTLEDISEYGYSLIWGKDCAKRAWSLRNRIAAENFARAVSGKDDPKCAR